MHAPEIVWVLNLNLRLKDLFRLTEPPSRENAYFFSLFTSVAGLKAFGFNPESPASTLLFLENFPLLGCLNPQPLNSGRKTIKESEIY